MTEIVKNLNNFNGTGTFNYDNGNIAYEGDIKNGNLNGKGKVYRKDRTLEYEGEFTDGKITGKGTMYKKDGKTIRYEGEFKDGMMNGKGILYREDRILEYDGEFKDSKKNGKGKGYNATGTLRYEGEWKAPEPFNNPFSRMDGKGILYYPDGKTIKYDGYFKHGMVVKGILYYPDGKTIKYKGNFTHADSDQILNERKKNSNSFKKNNIGTIENKSLKLVAPQSINARSSNKSISISVSSTKKRNLPQTPQRRSKNGS